MTGVYKITNLVNSKVYIGASKNVEERWWYHKNGHTAIAEDLKCFGLENFNFEVLLECPEDMLAQWERDMICLYDSDDPEKGYNNPKDRPYSLKVSESLKGRKLSEETRRKLSEALRGHNVSNEARRRISETRKGRSRSIETKRKISETLRGCTTSEETKRKMSEAHKEYWRKKKELNGLKIHSNNEKQNK